ncbi:MAG: MOSC domain-containing protein [Nitrospirota bacterium]|jgi:MOSC domain-containing protein YiiM
MKLLSLQIGLPQGFTAEDGKERYTAFAKRPVTGPLRLTGIGLVGDGVGNPKVHGGPDKAVCCYPSEHYPAWERELGVTLGPAAFGENFTTIGLNEENVHVGDRFRVGTALVEVSQPRQPCATLGAMRGRKGFVKEVQDSGRTGFYLRVVEEGDVAAGDIFSLATADAAAISIAEANRIHRDRRRDPGAVRRLLAVPALAAAWRSELERHS